MLSRHPRTRGPSLGASPCQGNHSPPGYPTVTTTSGSGLRRELDSGSQSGPDEDTVLWKGWTGMRPTPRLWAHPDPHPRPHRVKGWELEGSCGPLEEEFLRRGKGQAQVESKLGAEDRGQPGQGTRGTGGAGVGASPGGQHRRNPSSFGQEPTELVSLQRLGQGQAGFSGCTEWPGAPHPLSALPYLPQRCCSPGTLAHPRWPVGG